MRLLFFIAKLRFAVQGRNLLSGQLCKATKLHVLIRRKKV